MHSVAVTSSGEVYTAGVNDEGALGRKTGELSQLPLSLKRSPAV